MHFDEKKHGALLKPNSLIKFWARQAFMPDYEKDQGNKGRKVQFADDEDLGWMKKFCVISNIDPDNKDTCKGDSGSNILLYMTYIKIKIMLTVENVYT